MTFFTTSRHYSCVCINGKTYSRFHEVSGAVKYCVTCKGNVYRTLTTANIKAAIDAAILELAHTEALAIDDELRWAAVPEALKEVHHTRVRYGFELQAKHNTENVIEACHVEALAHEEYETARDNYRRECEFYGNNDHAERRALVEAAHAEALAMDAPTLTEAQAAYTAAQEASLKALCDAADGTGSEEAYDAAETKLEAVAVVLLQLAGRHAVDLAEQHGKSIAEINLLKDMFQPYFTGNYSNVAPGRRNQLIAQALKLKI